MPIYEFQCDDCRNIFEILEMSKDDRAETKCPQCGCESFARVLSRTQYTMGGERTGPNSGGPRLRNRSCQGGNCSTIELPGPRR